MDLLHNSLLPVEIQVYQTLSKNTLPAQEAIIKPIHFTSYLTTFHAARNVFTESESSNKLKNELQKSTRSFVNTYDTGNKVFYKRNISPKIQQKVSAKMDLFYSSDQVLDESKLIYAEFSMFNINAKYNQ